MSERTPRDRFMRHLSPFVDMANGLVDYAEAWFLGRTDPDGAEDIMVIANIGTVMICVTNVEGHHGRTLPPDGHRFLSSRNAANRAALMNVQACLYVAGKWSLIIGRDPGEPDAATRATMEEEGRRVVAEYEREQHGGDNGLAEALTELLQGLAAARKGNGSHEQAPAPRAMAQAAPVSGPPARTGMYL